MEDKIKVLLTFQKNGKNGGPYLSHQRIMDSRLKEKYEFIPLYFPRIREMLRPSVAKMIVNTIKTNHADILHFAGLQLEGFLALQFARFARVPRTVCAIHGCSQDAQDIGEFKKKLLLPMEKWTLRHSDICYGVSRDVVNWPIVKENARNCFGTIYNMYDINDDYDIDIPNTFRKEYSIPDGAIIVVSIGRITVDKGFEILKELILKKKDWENVYFVIVGDGAYRKQMQQELAEAGYHNVIFTGYQKNVGRILSASDIFILCTLHETFGNSVLEASSHCLPVIASNTGGIPEIICNGQSGFLFEVGNVNQAYDALKKLLTNPSLAKELGRYGKDYVAERFNCRKIEELLDEMYQSLME